MNFTLINAGIWLCWWVVWLTIGLLASKNIRRESLRNRAKHLVPLMLGIALVFSSFVFPVWYPLGLNETCRQAAAIGAVCGLLFTFWARFHLGRNWSGLVALKDGHSLVRSGPYRFVRHPIYSGLVVAMASTALSVSTGIAVVGALFWGVSFLIKLDHEERILAHAFRGSWYSLCAAVPCRLFPRVF